MPAVSHGVPGLHMARSRVYFVAGSDKDVHVRLARTRKSQQTGIDWLAPQVPIVQHVP